MRPILRTLAVLLAVLALEAAYGFATHASDDEVRAIAEGREDATVHQRAFALHVRMNRDVPPAVDPVELEALLASDEPLLRELAMTHDFARGEGAALQHAHVEDEDSSEPERFFRRHQIKRMYRHDLTAYYASR